MKTYSARPTDIEKQWFVVDAEGKTLGRIATKVAQIIQGKHKPMYTQHMDTGDFVIVVNADKFKVTGNKLADKYYYRHSGYPGGFRAENLETMLVKHPEHPVQHAVKGMLPKTRLGRAMIKKLKVYASPEHPHSAQKPKNLEV